MFSLVGRPGTPSGPTKPTGAYAGDPAGKFGSGPGRHDSTQRMEREITSTHTITTKAQSPIRLRSTATNARPQIIHREDAGCGVPQREQDLSSMFV